MSKFHWIPLLLIAVSLPMILGKVPLNRIYGFRDATTLEDPEAWYQANRVAGWFLFAAGGFSLCFNLAPSWIATEWEPGRIESWMELGVGLPVVLAALGAAFHWAGR